MLSSLGGTLGPMYESLTSTGGPPSKARKEQGLSLLLRRTADPLHCAGIEAVALSPDGDTVYTASRDATVRSWHAGGESRGGVGGPDVGRWKATYEGHSNWVNDVVTLGDRLVTCSSDACVCLWDAHPRAEGTLRPELTLRDHTDYVTCVAAARHSPQFVSGGLRGQVFLWDLNHPEPAEQMKDHRSPLGSVYALDISGDAKIVAVGSPEGHLRITDARQPERSYKLRGHTDNIRSILLKDDASLCLSASSDGTIRLWDMGQQRCVQTLAVHTDSVWTLQATADFGTIISGGRDCCVYRTHLASRTSELLVEETSPINRVAMSGVHPLLWVATTQSTVKCYDLAPKSSAGSAVAVPPSPRTPGRVYGRRFHVGASPQVRLRQQRASGHFGGDAQPADVCRLAAEIRGMPPLLRFSQMPDRRHVLTQDSEGQLARWDVTCGAIKDEYGKADLGEKERELFASDMVAQWFTADVKLGSLAIHLETPSCFAAEIYAREYDDDCDAPDDLRYNFGEHLLKAALQKWVHALSLDYLASGSAHGAGPEQLAETQTVFHLQSDVPPLLMGKKVVGGQQRSWTKATDEMDGSESELLPQWVKEAVLHSSYTTPPELKCAFILLPKDGSGLPSLNQSRLNAPRILKMGKVSLYVINKLEMQVEETIFVAHKCYYNSQWQTEEEQRQGREAEMENEPGTKVLEFTCNGYAVPFDLSLAAVRSFMWRRSDSVVVHFGIYNPSKPAPRPIIKPQ